MENIKDYLIQVAKQGKVATYSEVNSACELGLDFNNIKDRNIIAEMLGELSESEYKSKRPLLSSIVVLKGQSPLHPADGFHKMAIRLGVNKNQEENTFWVQELGRCFNYWRGKDE